MRLHLPPVLRKVLFASFQAVVFVSVSANASAALWTSGSDWNWINGANWDTGVAPNAPGAIAGFDLEANRALVNQAIALSTDITLGQLNVTGKDAEGREKLTLAGAGTLVFNNSGSDALLYMSGNLDLIVSNNIRLEDNTKFHNDSNWAGSLTLGGNIALDGQTLELEGGSSYSTMSANGIISGTGGLIKSGNGNLILNGANTFVGDVSFKGGSITVNHDSAFGDSSNKIILSSGSGLKFITDGNRVLNNALEADSSTHTITVGGRGSLTFDGTAISVFNSGTGDTAFNIEDSTTLAFGAAHQISSAGGIIKDGEGTLVLGSGDNNFDGLRINAGTVRTGEYTGDLVLGRADAGSNMLGKGDITVVGKDNYGIPVTLELNGTSASSTYFDGAIGVTHGATMIVNSGNIYLNGGSLDFGTGALKGNVIFNGDVWLGNMTMSNTGGSSMSFTEDVRFMDGSTIAAMPGIKFDLTGTGSQEILLNVPGNNLFINGTMSQKGTGETTVGNIGELTLNALDISEGTFKFGSNADIVVTGGITMEGGNLVFGKDGQYGGAIGADGSDISIDLNGYSQVFTGLTLGVNTNLTFAYGTGSATADLGMLTIGTGGVLRVRDWTSGINNLKAITSNLGDIWFYGYNKGAATNGSGEIIPVSRLEVEFVNNAAGDGQWKWGNASNWINSIDGSVDSFNIPDAPGITVKFGNLAGDLANKPVDLDGETITVGTLIYQHTTGISGLTSLRNGKIIFDSGVAGEAAKIIKGASGSGFQFLTEMILRSDLEYNTAGGYPQISNGMIAEAVGVDPVTGEQYGRLIKTGAGELRFSSIGLGSFDRNIHLREGVFSLYGHNMLGSGEIVLQGGRIGARQETKYRVSNALRFEANFSTYSVNYTYSGDIDLSLGGTFTGSRQISIGYPTLVAGERASVTFGEGFNFIGAGAGLVVNPGSNAMEMLSNNNSFDGGLTVSVGTLYTTLRGDMLLGGYMANGNYLGAGNITVSGSSSQLIVTTQGHNTTFSDKVFTLSGSGKMRFEGGGDVLLSGGELSGGSVVGKGTLIADGDIIFDGTTITNTPGITLNASGTDTTVLKATAGNGGVTGIGVLGKTGTGTSIIDGSIVSLGVSSVNVASGVLRLGGSGIVSSTATLNLAGGLFDANGHSQTLGGLQLTANSGILLGDTGKLTFASADTGSSWNGQLNIQSSSSNDDWAITKYVRFLEANGLNSGELAKISFTGYETGAIKEENSGYWYLKPAGAQTNEWLGASAIANWSDASNWLGVVPDANTASATIRDIDANLSGKTLLVDSAYTVNHLNMESSGGQIFTIGGNGVLTLAGSDAWIRHSGGSTVSISSGMDFASDTTLQLLVDPGKGFLNMTGALTGSGDVLLTGGGTLRISGDNTGYEGDFIWSKASLIQVMGGSGASQAVFGKGTLHIGDGISGNSQNFVFETRFVDDDMVGVLGYATDISTDYTLSGNLIYRKQTVNGTEVSNSAGKGVVHLTMSGDGVIADGNHHITVYGNSIVISSVTEYLQLSLTGNLSGSGALILDGWGRTNFYGENSDYSGNLTINCGMIGVKENNSLGTGLASIGGAGVSAYNLQIISDQSVSLANPFDFTKGLTWSGNVTYSLDYDGSMDNGSGGFMSTVFNGNVQWGTGSNTTVVFGENHIATGGGQLRHGQAGGYSSLGTTRFLSNASTWTGGVWMHSGTVQAGASSVWQSNPGGGTKVWRNGVLEEGSLISGALGTGNLQFAGGRLAAYSGDSSVTGQRLSNKISFETSTAMLGADDKANRLIFDTESVILRNGIGDLRLDVSGNAHAYFESQFVGDGVHDGGITKTGTGTLELGNGNNLIVAGMQVFGGFVRAVQYEYDFGVSSTEHTGIATGNVTVGKADSGNNYFGTGVLYTNAANVGYEVLTTDGSTVHIAKRSDGQDTLLLNKGGVFSVKGGGGVITTLEDGLALRVTEGALGTFSSTGTIYADNLSLGIHMQTPNLEINTNKTLSFTQNNVLSKTGNLTLNDGSVLKMGGVQQSIGGSITLNGVSYLDFTGASSMLSSISLIDIITGSGAAPNTVLNILGWESVPATGLGNQRIVVAGASQSQVFANVHFGAGYSQGGVTRYLEGVGWVLTPLGQTFYWDGRNGSTWSDQNWCTENSGSYTPVPGAPILPGSVAVFKDLDTSLNGKTISLGATDVKIGTISIEENTAANFTIGGAGANGFIMDGAGAGTSINVTSDSTSNVVIASSMDLYSAGEQDFGLYGMNINHEGSGLLTLSGKIEGMQSVTKTGSGILVLSGESRFTYGFNLKDGTVRIGVDGGASSGPLGASWVNIGENNINSNIVLEAINGARLLGANQVRINNDFTVKGELSFNNAGKDGEITADSAVTIGSGDVLRLANKFSGAGVLTKTGAGLLEMSGDSVDYAAGIILEEGTLAVGSHSSAGTNKALGTGQLQVTGDVTLTNNATTVEKLKSLSNAVGLASGKTLAVDTAGGDLTLSGVISGAGTINKTSSNILTLSGNSSYSGGTTVTAGTLKLTGATSAGTGAITNNLGSIVDIALSASGTVGNAIANAGTLNVTGNGATLGGVISGGGEVNISGTGTAIAGSNTTTGLWTITSTGSAGFSANDNFGTSAMSLAGTLTATGSGAIDFTHTLSGAGTFNINNTGGFSFGAGVGEGFTGLVNINNAAAFTWNNTGSTALKNAHLSLNSGSLTTLSTSPQSARELTLNGGRLDVSLGTINVTDLNVNLAGAEIVFDPTRFQNQDLISQNILTSQTVISSTNAWGGTGSVANISLVKNNGDSVTNPTILDINQSSVKVAEGTYSNGMEQQGNNLNLTYQLTAVKIMGDQTLDLTQTNGKGAQNFTAKITGTNTGSNLTIQGGTDAGDSLTFTQTADHLGTTTINGGVIKAGVADLFAANKGLIVNAGTFELNGFNQTVKGLDGTGGTISLGSSALTVNGGGTYSGVLTGTTGSLAKNGTETLTLNGDNSYGGTTAVNAGTLVLGGNNTGAGVISVSNGATLQVGTGASGMIAANVSNNGNVQFNRSNDATYAGIISGTGTLDKAGAGTLTLSGVQIYTGATTISGGTLKAGTVNIIRNSASLTLGANTTFDLANYNQQVNNLASAASDSRILLGSGKLTASNTLDTSFAGVISGTGGLDKTGAATLTLGNVNTYTGATTIIGGTLKAGVADVIKNSSSLTLGANTTFDLANYNQQVNNLASSSSNSRVLLGSGKLTVNNTTNTNFVGVISGTGGLDKTGAATLTLGNVSTYTGATTINGGTLRATVNNIISNSASVTLAANAALDVNGTSQIINNLVSSAPSSNVLLGSNGTLTANNNAATTFAGAINGNGTVNKTGAETLTLSGAGTYTGTTNITAGLLKLTNAQATGTSAVSVSPLALGTGLELAFNNATYGNNISGAGRVTVSGSQVELSGTNTLSGIWNITGSAKASNAGNLGTAQVHLDGTGVTGVLNLETGSAYDWAFNNQLTGTGTMNVNLNTVGSKLTFGATVGSAFTGLLNMTMGTFNLDSNGASSLANGTLKLSSSGGAYSGGVAVVQGSGSQTINDLTMDGGTLQFNFTGKTPDAVLNVNTLNTSGGGYVAANGINGLNGIIDQGGSHAVNFFDDSGDANRYQLQVVAANDVTSLTQLQLVDGNGNILTGPAKASTIQESGVTTGTAYYDYVITTGTNPNGSGQGVYIGYGLKRIDAASGRQVALANGSSTGALDAQLTGTGGFIINGTGNVLMGNAASSYTGKTNLNSGTVIMQTNNTFGQTSELIVASGAGVSMNGNSQTIGILTNRGTIALGGGSLTISNGGTNFGTLSGAGTMNLTGGTLDIINANTGLTANINLTGSSTANLSDVASLGNSGVLNIASGSKAQLDAASGDLSKTLSGAGTVALVNGSNINLASDNSSFGGNFNLAGGTTLKASQSNHLGSASIVNNGVLNLEAGSDWTMNSGNVISGTGKVTKTGGNALTINHANSYSGGTDISAGTIRVGNSQALGTGAVLFVNNSTLELAADNLNVVNNMVVGSGTTANLKADGSIEGILGGVINGPGAVEKTGTGTVILTGTNMYAGGTTITGGKLQLGNGGMTGSVIGNILDNAALEFNYGSGAQITYASVISGSGTVAKTGAGILILTGTNTYTGLTTVTGGKLQLGNGGSTGSIVSDIVNNASLEFNYGGGAQITYAGEISGSGTVAKTNAGTLYLSGDNSYAGTTTVNGGMLVLSGTNTGTGQISVAGGTTLQVGNGGASGRIVAGITNNGSVVFDRAGNDTYNGVISGGGTLTKAGTGVITLGGNSTYSGQTYLNQGGLILTHQEATGTGTVNLAAGTGLELAFSNAVYDNSITGAGTVSATGTGISVTANNNASGFTGGWDVKSGGSVNITSLNNLGTLSAIANVDGILNYNANTGVNFDRVLTGSGTVNVALGSSANTMNFNTSAIGSGFDGNIRLTGGQFELGATGQSAINAGAMANATLVIGNGNTTYVKSDASIGNLTFESGGTLDLTAQTATSTAKLTTGHIDVESGTTSIVNIDASQLGIPPGVEPTVNFLDADELTNGGMKVVDSDSVSTDGKHLGLTVNGNASPYAVDLVVSDGVNHDIVATYDYITIASSDGVNGQGAGLYVDYVLTQLESVTNLILSNATSTDSTLSARLTGSGDITINDSKSGIILNNNLNDYTGETNIINGKLVAGVNDALGQTTGLNMASGTIFDLNMYTQTINGDVNNDDGLVMIGSGTLTVNGEYNSTVVNPGWGKTNVGTGTLKLNGGGTISGDNALVGQYEALIHIDPSDLVVNGSNVNYKGDVLVEEGSSVTLDHVNGLGENTGLETGKITLQDNAGDNANGLADRLILNITNVANAGEFTKYIEGNGLLSVDTVADIILNNSNTEFTGNVEVEHGRIVATNDKAVGTSVINVVNGDAAFVWQSLTDDANVANSMSGAGTVIFEQTVADLTGTNTVSNIRVTESALDVKRTDAFGSSTSNVTIDDMSQVTLSAFGSIVGNVNNSGQIILAADNATFTSLDNAGMLKFDTPTTVTGDFKNATIGSLSGAGVISFNLNFAELTDDFSTSPSGFPAGDHLTVSDSASGTHTVLVNPVGSLPTTGNGRISLITTSNFIASADTFRLPVNLEGRETLDVGSYAYALRQGDGTPSLPSANDWYLVGDSLSKMAEAILGSASGMGLGFMTEMDQLVKRMGDLRLSQRHATRVGFDNWVNTYGWETNANNQVSGTPFRETYYGADTGMDKRHRMTGGNLYTGLFFGMGKSDREFNGFGSGKTDGWRTGVYGTYIADSGWYLDFVGKLGRYEHEINTLSTYGDKGYAEYKQTGFGFSLEAGKQIMDEDGWFAEPQAQVSYAHIQGKDYTVNGFIPVDVNVQGQDVFQARGGVRFGKNIKYHECVFQPYVKGSAVGMWTNGGRVSTSDGLSRRATMDGARMELGAGVIWDMYKAGQVYVDYEYVRAQRFETPWRINVGYRFQW